jgi:hypothetical protein
MGGGSFISMGEETVRSMPLLFVPTMRVAVARGCDRDALANSARQDSERHLSGWTPPLADVWEGEMIS